MTVFRERCVFRLKQTFFIGFATWFDFDKKMRNFRGFCSKHTQTLLNGSFHKRKVEFSGSNVGLFSEFFYLLSYFYPKRKFFDKTLGIEAASTVFDKLLFSLQF